MPFGICHTWHNRSVNRQRGTHVLRCYTWVPASHSSLLCGETEAKENMRLHIHLCNFSSSRRVVPRRHSATVAPLGHSLDGSQPEARMHLYPSRSAPKRRSPLRPGTPKTGKGKTCCCCCSVFASTASAHGCCCSSSGMPRRTHTHTHTHTC